MNRGKQFVMLNLVLVFLLLVLTPVVASLATIVSFYTGSNALVIAVFVLYAVSTGYAFARVLRAFNGGKIVAGGVAGSTVFAGILGLQKVLSESLRQLGESFSRGAVPGSGMGGVVNTEGLVEPNLLFILVLTSFNASILYVVYQRGDVEWRYLLLYAVPLAVYLLVPAVFSGGV